MTTINDDAIEHGEVWIDPDTGLGWTIIEIDGDVLTLQAYVTQDCHVSMLRKNFRYDPHDHA